MATDRDKKGKVSLTIRARNNKKTNNKSKNASTNDASKLKELNKAFESPATKGTKGTKVKTAKKEKVEKTKEKKPRKLNAYMVFAMEVRESVKKNNPTASIIDIAKKIGALWRALSDSEKAKYKK